MSKMRAVTVLNRSTGVSVVWTPGCDAGAEAVIERMMADGYVFMLTKPRLDLDACQIISKADSVQDPRLAGLVETGGAVAVATPNVPAVIEGRAKTARQAACRQTIAIAPKIWTRRRESDCVAVQEPKAEGPADV